MANQNLSQFGENTSVSDADYTFVWDSANSISKKVSRNSWLTSPSLSTSAPVTISQTWADSGQTFKALVVNAAGSSDANSASGSLLADFQVDGVSKSKVDKSGFITSAGVYVNVVGKAISNPTGQQLGFGYTSNGCAFYRFSTAIASFVLSASVGGNSSGLNLGTDALGFAASATGALYTILLRDSASGNTLALRNGTAAQTFNVYGTWTTAITNFERLAIKYNTSDVAYQIAAEKGTDNGDYRPLQLWTGGASRLHITTAGNVGIGTTLPTSKLHVTGGDVEIETVTSGIIMKAAGTSTRYRITLNATGDALVFTAI